MIIKVIITLIMSVKLTNGKALKGVFHKFRAHTDTNFSSIPELLNKYHSCISKNNTFVNSLFKDATTMEYFKDDVVDIIKKNFLKRCINSAGATTWE